jgi:uncharacterized protein YbjT (DUF2867 family)
MQATKVLVAGATGYLGGYVARELKKRNYYTVALVRNAQKLAAKGIPADQVITAALTDKNALEDCCQGIDVVFSAVGITSQKDGLTYMDVDYQANLNLLEAAKRSGVKQFIYVAVLHGDQLRRLKICAAKEKFVDALKSSGLNYCVIRPTGYFSDMGEFYKMAEKGRIFLFGNGQYTTNPIHGEDLATVCVNAIEGREREMNVGGPEILTHEQIARIAFSVAGNQVKITHIPHWVRKGLLFLLRTFTSSKTYGPIEFFMTVLSMDLIAPAYGVHTLQRYFETLKSADSTAD